MRKLLALFFLSVYLISTTELAQLLKSPVLVVHYLEHKGHDGTLSFTQFLMHHYKGNHLEDHPHNDDYAQDVKLPFMVHNPVLSFCFIPVNPLRLDAPKTKVPIGTHLNIRLVDDTLIDSNYQSSIWQPPKNS